MCLKVNLSDIQDEVSKGVESANTYFIENSIPAKAYPPKNITIEPGVKNDE